MGLFSPRHSRWMESIADEVKKQQGMSATDMALRAERGEGRSRVAEAQQVGRRANVEPHLVDPLVTETALAALRGPSPAATLPVSERNGELAMPVSRGPKTPTAIPRYIEHVPGDNASGGGLKPAQRKFTPIAAPSLIFNSAAPPVPSTPTPVTVARQPIVGVPLSATLKSLRGR